MNVKKYLDELTQKFRSEEFEVTEDMIGKHNVVIARKYLFRLFKPFSGLTTFCIVGHFDSITENEAQEFSEESLKYARSKGLFSNLRGGLCIFPIIISSKIGRGVKSWSSREPKKRMNKILMPVVFNISKNELSYFNGNPFYGGLRYPKFRMFLRTYLSLDGEIAVSFPKEEKCLATTGLISESAFDAVVKVLFFLFVLYVILKWISVV